MTIWRWAALFHVRSVRIWAYQQRMGDLDIASWKMDWEWRCSDIFVESRSKKGKNRLPTSCFCQRGENRASVLRVFWQHAFSARYGMFTFARTCDTRACYVTSWVGWGGDSMRRLSKSAIPCSLATRVNGHVNPKLMRSIRIWQWICMNSKEDVLEKTGRMLDKRMDSWKRKKKSREFSAQKSV